MIIATRGNGHYLDQVDDRHGRVLVPRENIVGPIQLIDQILKWGYWEPVSEPYDLGWPKDKR